MPLYPAPVVRGLLVYTRGMSTRRSFTCSCTLASLETYSSTASSRSAEQGPTITRNLSLSPSNTCRISRSRSSLMTRSFRGRGYSPFNSSGPGSCRLYSIAIRVSLFSFSLPVSGFIPVPDFRPAAAGFPHRYRTAVCRTARRYPGAFPGCRFLPFGPVPFPLSAPGTPEAQRPPGRRWR